MHCNDEYDWQLGLPEFMYVFFSNDFKYSAQRLGSGNNVREITRHLWSKEAHYNWELLMFGIIETPDAQTLQTPPHSTFWAFRGGGNSWSAWTAFHRGLSGRVLSIQALAPLISIFLATKAIKHSCFLAFKRSSVWVRRRRTIQQLADSHSFDGLIG